VINPTGCNASVTLVENAPGAAALFRDVNTYEQVGFPSQAKRAAVGTIDSATLIARATHL
jgi:hypothetical protein